MKYLWLLVLLPAMALAQTNEQNLSQLGIRPPSGTPGNFALHWPASGLPSWIADTGTPGGTSGQIQYNNSGSFGGISNVSSGILIGQASGAPVFYATSGDCTISTTGVVSCTKINGLTFPALVSGDCLTNNGTALSWGTCGGGSGTVTSFAFTNGNGFTGTVTNPTTTPALSLAPSFTGLAYSSGSALGAATVGQGLSFSSGTISTSYTPRVVTIATDTIASTDCGNYVKYTDAASVAVTLPQATGSFAGCSVDIVVPTGDGPVTVTPTTSTINGASTLVVNGGKFATITADSGNYDAIGTAVGSVTQTIASGTAALGTTAIASGACATAVTVAASGVLTTDTINAGFNGDPTAITGFTPSTSGMLTIVAYPTAGNVNFKVCNLTTASVTPGAVTLNWHVVR